MLSGIGSLLLVDPGRLMTISSSNINNCSQGELTNMNIAAIYKILLKDGTSLAVILDNSNVGS